MRLSTRYHDEQGITALCARIGNVCHASSVIALVAKRPRSDRAHSALMP